MDDKGKIIVQIKVQRFDEVESKLINADENSICNMINDSTYAYSLKPQLNDFDNMKNLLESAKQGGRKIKLIFKDSLPNEKELYVINLTEDPINKNFTLIASTSI